MGWKGGKGGWPLMAQNARKGAHGNPSGPMLCPKGGPETERDPLRPLKCIKNLSKIDCVVTVTKNHP